MDRTLTTRNWQFCHCLVMTLLIALPSGKVNADDLETRFKNSEQTLKDKVDQYRSTGDKDDQRDQLTAEIRKAIREHLEIGDRLRLQQIDTAKKRLEVAGKRLVDATKLIDRRVESELERLKQSPVIEQPKAWQDPETKPPTSSDVRVEPLHTSQATTSNDQVAHFTEALKGRNANRFAVNPGTLPDDDLKRFDQVFRNSQALAVRISDLEKGKAEAAKIEDRKKRERISGGIARELELARAEFQWMRKRHKRSEEIIKNRLKSLQLALDIAKDELVKLQSLRKSGVATASTVRPAELAVAKAESAFKEQLIILEHCQDALASLPESKQTEEKP